MGTEGVICKSGTMSHSAPDTGSYLPQMRPMANHRLAFAGNLAHAAGEVGEKKERHDGQGIQAYLQADGKNQGKNAKDRQLDVVCSAKPASV